jgi:excisionase family DNA binding protein
MESLIQTLRGRTWLLSVAEISELLSFHPVTIRDWSRLGRIPAMRIAGQWRFDPLEIVTWVEARRMG